jgi:hypothetical protein
MNPTVGIGPLELLDRSFQSDALGYVEQGEGMMGRCGARSQQQARTNKSENSSWVENRIAHIRTPFAAPFLEPTYSIPSVLNLIWHKLAGRFSAYLNRDYQILGVVNDDNIQKFERMVVGHEANGKPVQLKDIKLLPTAPLL